MIDECRPSVENLRDELDNNNPKLFAEYLKSDVPEQNKIENRLQDAHKLSKLKASSSWHQWLVPKYEEFVDGAKAKLNEYTKMNDTLTKNHEAVSTQLPDLESMFTELKEKLAEERKKKEEEEAARRTLAELKSRVEQQKILIDTCTPKTEKLIKTLDDLKARRAFLENQKAAYDRVSYNSKDIVCILF